MSKFVYYNVNPYGDKEEDCVCRAITFCTGLDYHDVEDKLRLIGRLMNCEKLCVCCYRHLLDDIFKFKRVDCDYMSVGEFADNYPYGTYIVRMNGHLSSVKDNTVYDIFDCRKLICTDAWKVD